MKTSLFVFVVSWLSCSAIFANDEKFIEAMQKNIRMVYEAGTTEELINAVNAFERIANAEKRRWEPLYYQAFGNIMVANRENDPAKKDQYLDRAISVLAQAKTLRQDDSEVIALEGFALMMKVSVDPQTRGMVYAPQATAMLEKARALDPENPRALALLAQMQFGTAQFFGSSIAEACDLNMQALEKMELPKAENPIAPTWGKSMIESLAEKCK